MRSTGVFRSLSWFRSWKSSVDVSRMVLRVWTMVEANVRSSSRSRMSAIEWKMLSACSRRQSCLGVEVGQRGTGFPCEAGGRAACGGGGFGPQARRPLAYLPAPKGACSLLGLWGAQGGHSQWSWVHGSRALQSPTGCIYPSTLGQNVKSQERQLEE